MQRLLTVIILVLPVVLFIPWFKPDWVQIQEIRALDGDTVKFLWNGRWVSGRLIYIDAPELEQKEGLPAFHFLKKWIQEPNIEIKMHGLDFYQRHLIELKNSKENLNFLLVKKGLAMLYPYSKFSSIEERFDYQRAQLFAYNKKLGLWKNKFINPSYWRRCRKNFSKLACEQRFSRSLRAKKKPRNEARLFGKKNINKGFLIQIEPLEHRQLFAFARTI